MHLKNIINKYFLIVFILFGLILHFISIFYSIGFYSDDEHFQVLEISAYLHGINPTAINDPSDYYWEWNQNTRMRPWLQPYIYAQIIYFLKLFSNANPFFWVFCLRLISSILGFISIIYLFFVFKDIFFKKNKIFNYFLFFTFWFYPFLHSRTSSENLSLSLFIISFCILFQIFITEKYKFNWALFSFGSFILGISMVAKFTTVFTALPIFFWLLIFKFNFIRILIFGSLILVALTLGLYIDYIHWGSFKNTYYQFYIHNLSFGEVGRMKYFGVSPWYYYFIEIIKQLAPLLSLFFLIGLILFWIKNKTNILTWITLSTFIIFSSIGHKEIRYIFPIYIFAPFFIAYLLDYIRNTKIIFSLQFIIIVSNVLFLIITALFPINSKVGVYKYIYNNFDSSNSIYYIDENPYLINNMEPYLYTSFLPKIKKFNYNDLGSSNFILISNNQIIFDEYNLINCKEVYSAFPSKIINLNKNWRRLKLNWKIYNCQPF